MVLKQRDADGDDGAAAGVDSARRSIDEGWASLTSGADRGPDDDRADGSHPAGDDLQAAYDAASRRAAEWYGSRLGAKGDEKRPGQHGRTRHVSGPGMPTDPDDRTRPAARVDR
jgi:hypothetical protein